MHTINLISTSALSKPNLDLPFGSIIGQNVACNQLWDLMSDHSADHPFPTTRHRINAGPARREECSISISRSAFSRNIPDAAIWKFLRLINNYHVSREQRLV